MQTGVVKLPVERRRDDSPGAKRAESPSEKPKRSAGGPSSPSGKSPTKKPEKKVEEFEEERDNGEPDELAEKFFRSFAEVKGTPSLGKSEKISIKAFMFNYKVKFYERFPSLTSNRNMWKISIRSDISSAKRLLSNVMLTLRSTSVIIS